MNFGNGYTPQESAPVLEDGFYKAQIKRVLMKASKNGGSDYIEVTVLIIGHEDATPNKFFLYDRPEKPFNNMTIEQSRHIWDVNMTKFFDSFQIPRGNFEIIYWHDKIGDITVRKQKNSEFKEIVPYKVNAPKYKNEKNNDVFASTKATETKPEVVQNSVQKPQQGATEEFPDDIPF